MKISGCRPCITDTLVLIDDAIMVGVDETREFLLLHDIDRVMNDFKTKWFGEP